MQFIQSSNITFHTLIFPKSFSPFFPLKFIYSICGYNNALVFKDITSSDIDDVVKFAQNDLEALLKKAFENSQLVLDDGFKSCFYGIFAVSPGQFSFSGGDKKLIQLMANCVKNRVEQANGTTDTEYFKLKYDTPKNFFKSKDLFIKKRIVLIYEICILLRQLFLPPLQEMVMLVIPHKLK